MIRVALFYSEETGVLVPAVPLFVLACADFGITVIPYKLDQYGLCTRFAMLYKSHKNVIVFGCKKTNEEYHFHDKNVLFLENGDFVQKFGMFIDAEGLFEYSSFCVNKRYNLSCNENLDTVKHLITNELQAKFPITKRRDGEAVLIALQYELDAPVQFSFPFKTKISPTEFMLMVVRECIGDEEIIVRPHPKHLDSFEENKAKYLRYFKPHWKLQIGGNPYSFLQAHCKGMVTINSTLAIEGAAMGIDVAVLGKRTYTGAGVVHELYENGLDSIKKLGTFQVAPNLVNYLCVLLNHTLSCPITKQKILDNEQFRIWIERCKNGSVFNHNG